MKPTRTTAMAAVTAGTADAPATVLLVPTRDLAWGAAATLPKDVPFDFPADCAQALLDAGAVRRPADSPTAV